MANREPIVDEVAAAILDGSPIDWEIVDTTLTVDRALIDELRLLSAVADLHRRQPGGDVLDATPAGTWGHLRLLERVGVGSFGDVYRAHDTRLEREVAVKLMPAPRSDAGIAEIIREGRLLARVRHPGVVTIYDAQQIGDRVGLWMEFVRGQTLEERLEQHGACTAADAIDIGIELSRAVSAVHEAGLIHRDIKTQNVMRADDGRLVLMDFGVGGELTDGSVAGLAGTPLYMAPEMFRGRSSSVRTDVYAIGVLLFHILTASFPVRAKLVSELQRAHQNGDRQALLDVRPDLAADLAAVVDRAIDPDPDRRFGSAVELGAALEAVRPRVRSRGWMIGVAAGLVLVAGAALAIERGWIAIGRDDGPFLNPQQWILIGEFTGTTGDAGLDAALRQAVTSELEASSYLNVFPAAWVRERLAAMSRPADARIDDALGLEISKREGLAALVTGSIEVRKDAYRIGLRATHIPTGRVVVAPTEERRSREDALHAAFGLGRRMRELLGENGASIQAAGPSLAPVTAQSFEASRHFALGRALYEEERFNEALQHFLEAARREPEFAMAHLYKANCHGSLGEHEQHRAALERAAALARDANVRLGQIEREKILGDYHSAAERFEQAATHYRAVLSLRPGDGRILGQLGLIYGMRRDYPHAIQAFEAAEQSYPHWRVKWMLADMYSASGRPGDATALLQPHLDRAADWIAYAKHFAIADNRQEARDALAEAERRSNASGGDAVADVSLAKADFLRSEGRYDQAEVALQQGLDRAADRRTAERLELAMTSLVLDTGRRGDAIAHVRRIDIGLSRNRIVHGVLAARAGDLETASAILAHLEAEAAERQAKRPEARVWQLRAEIALARRDAPAAHELAARAVRAFPTTWTLTTLARALQAADRISEAIDIWTSILARPGERAIDFDAPAYAQFVLAWYELARLYERAGRTDDARAAYDEFLRFWQDADADLPALIEARARRARLGRVSGSAPMSRSSGQGAQSTPAGRVPKPAA